MAEPQELVLKTAQAIFAAGNTTVGLTFASLSRVEQSRYLAMARAALVVAYRQPASIT